MGAGGAICLCVGGATSRDVVVPVAGVKLFCEYMPDYRQTLPNGSKPKQAIALTIGRSGVCRQISYNAQSRAAAVLEFQKFLHSLKCLIERQLEGRAPRAWAGES